MTLRAPYLALLGVLAATASAVAAPLGPPGVVATYALNADPAQRPEFERERSLTVVELTLGLGPVEVLGGREFQWARLSFARLNSQTYEAWLLLDSWPQASRVPQVAGYLWREPDWPDAVEFVNETTDAPQLPRLSMWEYGWPRSVAGSPFAADNGDFAEAVQFQGYPFRRAAVDTGQAVIPPTDRTLVKLNPDLIIGHITRDTDVAGKPFWALEGGKYEYRPTAPEDHRRHFEAGFSLFQATPRTDWLTRSNAWDNTLFWYLDDWPAHLYRSNYWGRAVYLDEPAIHNRVLDERLDLAGKLTPAEAAKELQRLVSGPLWVASGNYSRVMINGYIDAQFGRGDLQVTETENPVWEAIWTTAWYQLAVPDGVGGIVDEDTGVGDLVEGYNRAFGTQIPPTVQNACAIRVAVLRGAARNFGKRWGVAFYSPAESRLKASTISYLYDKGASYFWVWTGWVGIGDNSGLPYSYQRYYASLVKQAQAANPKRDMVALRNAARTCIVIPYGYTFAPHPLQYLKWLHLEHATGQGATYRQVLTNAALEVERCIRLGVDFDIAVEDPEFTAAGYDEIIFCRQDGSVVLRGPDGETRLPAGREPARPDLGPGPALAIQPPETRLEAPTKATLTAIATAGTGEFENAKPQVAWEVYGPDQGVRLTTGGEIELDLPAGGVYRVRAAVADIFGRPAVAWTELPVGETRMEAAVLPPEWAFQTDPGNVGQRQGWHAPAYDESTWQQIAVPAWWETTPAGAYDGYAWYRTRFTIPAELQGRELVLDFAGVDEGAWVYLNGELIGERSAQSTGLAPIDFWDKPFTFPAKGARIGAENVLAVRVYDSEAMGGLFRPVRLLALPR